LASWTPDGQTKTEGRVLVHKVVYPGFRDDPGLTIGAGKQWQFIAFSIIDEGEGAPIN
jgi:hypothetical protein